MSQNHNHKSKPDLRTGLSRSEHEALSKYIRSISPKTKGKIAFNIPEEKMIAYFDPGPDLEERIAFYLENIKSKKITNLTKTINENIKL